MSILNNFTHVKVHDGDSHILHKVGSLTKNHGLRTSIIIEVTDESEFLLLSLSADSLVKQPHELELKTIYEVPDIEYIRTLIQPIIRYNSNNTKRKNENNAIQLIKKQIDRVVSSFCDINDIASDDYKKSLSVFVNDSKKEIDRITKKINSENSINKKNIDILKAHMESVTLKGESK